MAIEFLRKEDLQKIFGIEKRKLEALIRTPGFPAVTIGRDLYVDPERLKEWLRENEGNKILLDYSKV